MIEESFNRPLRDLAANALSTEIAFAAFDAGPEADDYATWTRLRDAAQDARDDLLSGLNTAGINKTLLKALLREGVLP